MRLQLIILRHGLPATRILWTVRSQSSSHPVVPVSSAITSTRQPNATYGNGGCTIAQLLEDINEVVPLETSVESVGENEDLGGQWGLEDYVVEVNGFECLHYMHVDGLLRDGDEVVIRSLGVEDIRARRLSGRLQVAIDGRRLIDGVPFGRPYLQRSYSSRPPIRIPPRKRRRTTLSSWTGNLQVGDGYDDELQTSARGTYENQLALYDDVSEQGTVIRHRPNLFEHGDDDEDDDINYEVDEQELAEELKSLRDEADAETPFFESPDFQRFRATRAGRMSRMAHRDPIPTSSPARLSVVSTPRTNLARGLDGEASAKSTKSVHFEADISNFTGQLSEEDDSEVDSLSHASSSVSSNTPDSSVESSDETSDEDFSAEDSDADTSDESSISEESEVDSESESEDEELVEKQKPKAIDVYTPPGEGSRKTRNSNRRKKLRVRLQKLKSLGELPPEADFDDLRNWEAKHGKRPLTEVTEDKVESRSKEQSEIEVKRQQLLRDLASGGIDVDGHSEKENIPPRYRTGKQGSHVQEPAENVKGSPVAAKISTAVAPAEPNGADEEVKASPNEAKRRKLDLSSTKRLLFGSLGVRTPKSKEDEDALRTKLDGSRTKHITPERPPEVTVEKDDIDENWEQKIVLSATECVYDDIELTAPPFPFQQRWDRDACYAIRQRNNNGKKNKKRKQRDWQEEDTYDNHQDTTLNDADEGITLNYDDQPTTTEKEDLANNPNEDAADDLPELPSALDALPILTDNEVTVGSIVAFKHLDMSKATNWQPQVSDYKVAKVVEVHDNGILDLVLAKRDREVRDQDAVDEDGVRKYSGFEMPNDDDDDNDEVEDDGLRSMTFADLLEPRMIQAAIFKTSDKSQKEEALANGNHDEASLLSHPPSTPSVPVISAGSNAASVDGDEAEAKTDDEFPSLPPAPVSSQTRLEISHMIHDAGFRSAIDSELGRDPMLERFDKPRDSAIDMQSEAMTANAKVSSSNSELASSPPDVGLEEQDGGDSENSSQRNVPDENQTMNDGDNMAMDMDEPGFQMDVDDDFVMNDQSEFNGESQAGDDSDDGASLPRNDATTKRDDNELAANDTVSSMAGGKANPSPGSSDVQPSQQSSPRVIKKEPVQKFGSGEGGAEKSFLSTTVRAGTRSFTDPAAMDNGSDVDEDDSSSDYSDAHSTVPNPFYERDAAATKKAKDKATDDNPASAQRDPPLHSADASLSRRDDDSIPSSTSWPKSNQEANKETASTTMPVEKKGSRTKLDFDVSFLDENESEASDPDFPDIEVLWASTAPTQKEFPPIKMEVEAASQQPKSTADPEDSAASLPPIGQLSNDNPSTNEPVSTATKNNTSAVAEENQPKQVQQQAVSGSSSKGAEQQHDNSNNNDDDNNDNDSRPKSPSPVLPTLDFGSQQDTNDNADIDLGNDDEDDPYQHSADNSSHPDFHQQEEESQDHTIPMVDLTVSSPLVSPDESSDEDFAKSQGLPRGPGWVKKNVPTTGRQTRSSTGGGIVLSSSPPSRRRRRFTQSQF